MPVITAGSKSLPRLNDYNNYNQQRLCSRLAIFIYAVTALLALLYLLHRSAGPRSTGRLVRGQSAGLDITKAPRKTPPRSVAGPAAPLLSSRWVRLGQGQARLGTQANRAVSGGEASGTVPAGLGGFGAKIRMEEEERTRTPAASRSRGVSTGWRDGAGPSSDLSRPDPLFSAGEQGGHVRPSPSPPTTPARGIVGGPAGSFEMGQDSMDQDGLGATSFDGAHVSGGPAWETQRQGTTAFGQHLTDDEHILYGAHGPSGPGTGADRVSSTPRNFNLGFNRTTPPSTMASTIANYSTYGHQDTLGPAGGSRSHQVDARDVGFADPTKQLSSSVAACGTHVSGSIPIPSVPSPRTRTDHSLDDIMSPSSYPSSSPSLPPPPPRNDYPFDPAAIMYAGPGAVVDGGIRMVPPHTHGDDGAADVRGASENAGASWQRHTRVYGGGVCLACAAAAGGGGFYGARVRPEDRR